MAAGKLTQALVDNWATDQDVAVLTSYLATAPVIVPQGQQVHKSDLPAGDSVVLTAEDREVMRLTGMSEEDMKEGKKLVAADAA